MSTIQGFVKNKRGDALADVDLTFINRDTGSVVVIKTEVSGRYFVELPQGNYTWVAVEKGYSAESSSISIQDAQDGQQGPMIVLSETSAATSYPAISYPTGSIPSDFEDEADELFKKLKENRFGIEAPISRAEAVQAIKLFSVANLMLAGLSTYKVSNTDKIDIMGVLSLYYGLQNRTLASRLVVPNSERLWQSIEVDLDQLAKKLDQLQGDVDFLRSEAKRQFNIGTSNNVRANTQFPVLFRRFVEIGSDSLLAINIATEKNNAFFDKSRLEETYDLLRDLKEVIIQIVRSLSKYGTAATRRVNREWAEFESNALEVLDKVARERVSPDVDELNTWSTLALLTDQNRDNIVPYVALGKHGAQLLRYALEVYDQIEDQLDNFDSQHLQDLFQPDGNEKGFWTTKIRSEAIFIKRYPLANWGG